MINVGVKILSDNVDMPAFQTWGSVCFDIQSADKIVIDAGKTAKVPTGIALDIPDEYEAQIRPRSSTSIYGINIPVGTIDSDYKRQVYIIVQNNTLEPFIILPGERIAQIKIAKAPKINLVKIDNIIDTGRGGFGSTGR